MFPQDSFIIVWTIIYSDENGFNCNWTIFKANTKTGEENRLTLLKLNSSLNKDARVFDIFDKLTTFYNLFVATMENSNQPENWLIFQANSKIR